MESNSLYSELRQKLDDLGKKDIPITKTLLWHYYLDKNAGFPEDGLLYFSNNPPISKADASKRILICSTRSESDVLSKVFDPKRFSDDDKNLQREAEAYIKTFGSKHLPGKKMNVPELLKIRNQIKNCNKIQYCAATDTFWPNFFDSKDFLDRSVTIPKEISATGYLRNYTQGVGSTIDVSNRLKEIAKKWEVPINFIGTIAP